MRFMFASAYDIYALFPREWVVGMLFLIVEMQYSTTARRRSLYVSQCYNTDLTLVSL